MDKHGITEPKVKFFEFGRNGSRQSCTQWLSGISRSTIIHIFHQNEMVMKNNCFVLFATLCGLLMTGNLFAQQDKLYLKNGTLIEGAVTETSDETVKIKIKRNGDEDLIRTFSVEELDRIEFRDGTSQAFSHELEVTPVLDISEMKRRGIKINFFGPLYGHTDITYENQTKPGRAYEVTLGIIGLGKNRNIESELLFGDGSKRNAAGVFVSGGFKFQTKPTYRQKNKRYTHAMQGWFIKPTVTAGAYSQNRISRERTGEGEVLGLPVTFYGEPVVRKERITFGAVEIKAGKQWVFSNSFYMGFDLGVGYVFDNAKSSSDSFDFSDTVRSHYALTKFGSGNTNFAGSMTFQVGILF